MGTVNAEIQSGWKTVLFFVGPGLLVLDLYAQSRVYGVERWWTLDDVAAAFSLRIQYVVAALLVLGAVFGENFMRWRQGGRDPTGQRVVVPETEPPDRLRPAQLSVLMTEKVGVRAITATIIDLEMRGYLRIEDGAALAFVATDKDPTGLLGFEGVVHAALFREGPRVTSSRLMSTLPIDYWWIAGALYRDSVEHGWFVRNPEKVRALRNGDAGVLFMGGVGLAALLAHYFGGGIVGLAFMAAGIMQMAWSGAMPTRTKAGVEMQRRARGFLRYMDVAEADRARFAQREHLYSDYFSYAVAFGIVDAWTRAFAGVTTLDVSRWRATDSALAGAPIDRTLEWTKAFASTMQDFRSPAAADQGPAGR